MTPRRPRATSSRATASRRGRCSAWLECRLIAELHAQDAYDTCFGEAVAAAADPRIFANGRWDFRPDNAELQTIHHLGAGSFVQGGSVVHARR